MKKLIIFIMMFVFTLSLTACDYIDGNVDTSPVDVETPVVIDDIPEEDVTEYPVYEGDDETILGYIDAFIKGFVDETVSTDTFCESHSAEVYSNECKEYRNFVIDHHYRVEVKGYDEVHSDLLTFEIGIYDGDDKKAVIFHQVKVITNDQGTTFAFTGPIIFQVTTADEDAVKASLENMIVDLSNPTISKEDFTDKYEMRDLDFLLLFDLMKYVDSVSIEKFSNVTGNVFFSELKFTLGDEVMIVGIYFFQDDVNNKYSLNIHEIDNETMFYELVLMKFVKQFNDENLDMNMFSDVALNGNCYQKNFLC